MDIHTSGQHEKELSREGRLFGRHLKQKFFSVIFLVCFFIIIVGLTGVYFLNQVWRVSDNFAKVDVPALSNLYTLEEIASKQLFILEEFGKENTEGNKKALREAFMVHTDSANRAFDELENTLIQEKERTLNTEAKTSYSNFIISSEKILDGNFSELALFESEEAIVSMRDYLYKMSGFIKARALRNVTTLSETHDSMRTNLLVVSLSSLLIASLLALFLGRKMLLEPVLSLEEKTEELVSVNKELSVKNQILMEEESELSDSNQKLQSLDTAKTEFVSLVAHQLRTPLAGMKWSLDMLINGDLGEIPVNQKSMILKIMDTNDHVVRFVNDLLSVSRMESGRLEYNFVPTDLEHVAESVLLDIYPLSNKKQISINLRGKGLTMPKVSADTEKIRAVFQNLLENAVKYSPIGGKVTLEVRNRGSEVLVSVSDEGIGIPKDEQKDIFRRFFRATSAMKSQAEGSGLGLYLARSIVEGHGGKLWFESEPGKGSIFYFSLPVPKNTG